jgi:hypothetical protein
LVRNVTQTHENWIEGTELVDLWSAHNQAGGNATKVEAEYLEVMATCKALRVGVLNPWQNALRKALPDGPSLATVFWKGSGEHPFSPWTAARL